MIRFVNFPRIFIVFLGLFLTDQAPAFGMGHSFAFIDSEIQSEKWCYRSEEDEPCSGAPGVCIVNPDHSLGGFVANTASVGSDVILDRYARICDWALVKGYVQILDHAVISEHAQMFGNSKLSVEAKVFGFAKLYGYSEVSGSSQVHDQAEVFGRAQVDEQAEICEDAKVFGTTRVAGRQRVGHESLALSPRDPFANPGKNPIDVSDLESLGLAHEDFCPICHETFRDNSLLTRLECDCKYGYCPHCFKKWFRIRSQCPTCKKSVGQKSLPIYRLDLKQGESG